MPHIHELYDFTITVFIVHNDQVLLVDHPRYNKWIPMGGHVELNEDPEMALFREIQEETGLNVTILSTKPDYASPTHKPLLTPNYLDVHEANAPHKHIGLTYFAVSDSPDFVLSDEHTDMRWVPQVELASAEYNLTPDVIFYAQEALKLARQQT